MMPILPFLEDDPDNIRSIIRQASENGASYVIPAFGVTLRQGSREYFYRQLDVHFPGLKEKYMGAYGDSYQCSSPRWRQLNEVFLQEMEACGMSPHMPTFSPRPAGRQDQMPLFSL